jgi:hypothetical protein
LDHNTLDDVSILNRWIAKYDGGPVILRFMEAPLVAWHHLVSEAAAIDPDALRNPVPQIAVSDDEPRMEQDELVGDLPADVAPEIGVDYSAVESHA